MDMFNFLYVYKYVIIKKNMYINMFKVFFFVRIILTLSSENKEWAFKMLVGDYISEAFRKGAYNWIPIIIKDNVIHLLIMLLSRVIQSGRA